MKKIIIILLICCTFFIAGCSGKSAYDLAVDNGFNGTIEDYLDSLKGNDADSITIKDIFESLVELGYYDSSQYTDFLNDYLNDYLKEQNDEEVTINNSLHSTVSICAYFTSNNSTSVSSGSGVIYKLNQETGEAYIITNHHVIASSSTISSKINIYLYGLEYENYAYNTTLIGYSEENDIAVLKVNFDLDENAKYVQVPYIYSGRIYIGDSVYAMGNALGSGIAATKGIISYDSEYITTSYGEIRTFRVDAALNSGNSGGPVYNKNGELIGIVDAKIVDESVEGFGYAIPISLVSNIADNIIRNESNPVVVSLGISTYIKSSTMCFDELDLKYYIKETVVVSSINITSNASIAGVAVGDQLLSITINGIEYEIEREFILNDLEYSFQSNDEICIKIYKYSSNEIVECNFVL